jgi:hypothetical protein
MSTTVKNGVFNHDREYGMLLHTKQDLDSAAHRPGGIPDEWNGIFSATALSHLLKESPPDNDWPRIRHAIRTTLETQVELYPDTSEKAGLTRTTISQYEIQALDSLIDFYYDRSEFKGIRRGDRESAKRCALGFQASCK